MSAHIMRLGDLSLDTQTRIRLVESQIEQLERDLWNLRKTASHERGDLA